MGDKMFESLFRLFSEADLSPHGLCLLWRPELIWLHILSDSAIGLAYYSIPLALAYFVWKRPDVAFGWVFWMFGAFIVACGTTHWVEVWTLWHPDYTAQGLLKMATAIISVATAIMLWPLVPRAIALPSPSMLRRLNDELHEQVRERNRALAVSRESEERYRTLYNKTPVALQSISPDGRLVEVSDEWLKLLGYAREEVIGRPVADFHTPRSAKGLIKEVWPTLLRDGEVSSERQFVKKSGDVLDVVVTGRLERDGQGNIVRALGVVRDITARKQAEEALRREAQERQRAEEALRQAQKMEALGELTGGVAHDFNNLLMVINGNLELLRQKAMPAGADRRIEAIERAVRSGEDLTKKLLSFSRRQALQPKIVDLNHRIPKLADLLRHSLRGDIEIRVDVAPDLWPVEVDPGELELALINLAANARDAMPKGGTFSISGRNVTLHGEDENAGDLTGEFVSIAVTDTGTGIPEDIVQRVFEPFFTTKEVGQGTGLGLSQVYGFARQSDGTATVRSRPGMGTTVTLYLPRSTKSLVPESVEAALQAPQRGLGMVLLVEDNDEVAEVTAALLQQLGYRCERVEGPHPALDKLREGEKFDLVITDLVMPGGMNGIELARTLRGLYPGLPVLLTTGYSSAARDASSEGFPILKKPYHMAALNRAVRHALDERAHRMPS
ncbi:MAG TPA: PAS domain S-box protein [Stellaceae bacterium]